MLQVTIVQKETLVGRELGLLKGGTGALARFKKLVDPYLAQGQSIVVKRLTYIGNYPTTFLVKGEEFEVLYLFEMMYRLNILNLNDTDRIRALAEFFDVTAEEYNLAFMEYAGKCYHYIYLAA